MKTIFTSSSNIIRRSFHLLFILALPQFDRRFFSYLALELGIHRKFLLTCRCPVIDMRWMKAFSQHNQFKCKRWLYRQMSISILCLSRVWSEVEIIAFWTLKFLRFCRIRLNSFHCRWVSQSSELCNLLQTNGTGNIGNSFNCFKEFS